MKESKRLVKVIKNGSFWQVVYFCVAKCANYVNIWSEKMINSFLKESYFTYQCLEYETLLVVYLVNGPEKRYSFKILALKNANISNKVAELSSKFFAAVVNHLKC